MLFPSFLVLGAVLGSPLALLEPACFHKGHSMSANNLSHCLPVTLAYEGGWSNNAHDPGGATMKGVTQRVYDAYRRSRQLSTQTVMRVTTAELNDIYTHQYWEPIRGEQLPSGMDLVAFDTAVNSGPREASILLQQAVGGVKVDGSIGYATLDRLSRVNDMPGLIRRYCALRLSFMHRLRTWRWFNRGWSERVRSVQDKALGMVAP